MAKESVRCAIYTRRATDAGSDRGPSCINDQRERAVAYVEGRRFEGLEIHPERYDDRGHSGARMDRPALRRLLRDAADGNFEMVVACDIARLTRSQTDLLRIVEILDRTGVSLASVTEELNTSTPRGRMTLNLLLNICRHPLGEPS